MIFLYISKKRLPISTVLKMPLKNAFGVRDLRLVDFIRIRVQAFV